MTASTNRLGWLPWAGLYLLIWGAATATLARVAPEGLGAALVIGVLFGGVLSGLTWACTRKSNPVTIPVKRPALEMGAVAIWLAIYAIVCLGWLFTEIKHQVTPGTQQFKLTMMAVKLAIHVAIPLLILKILGAKLSPMFGWRAGQKGVLPLLLVVGALSIAINFTISPALKDISAVNPSLATLAWAIPGSFVWMAIEAGLCEEVLFRAVLQSRLAAFLRSEAGAAVIGAVLFGLAHAPGLFMRPDTAGETVSGGLVGIIAYTVGVLSPIGLLYGVIWARTRNLWLLIVLHALVDFLPNMPEFIRLWG